MGISILLSIIENTNFKYVLNEKNENEKPACATALEGQKEQYHAKFFICGVLSRAPCRYGMLLAKALGKEKAKIEEAFLVFLNISLLTRLLS